MEDNQSDLYVTNGTENDFEEVLKMQTVWKLLLWQQHFKCHRGTVNEANCFKSVILLTQA